MSSLLYIGPGMGIGTIILVFIISGIVLFSFGYLFWLKIRKHTKKNKK